MAGGQRAHLVALVRASATFHKGQLVERHTDIAKKVRERTPEEGTDHGSAGGCRVIM